MKHVPLLLIVSWLIVSGFVLGAIPCQGEAQNLGEVAFPTSGAAAAQEPFLRGLLLLHSFEYLSARQAFQQAQQLDPDFALAFWGEAMTHNHPIWLEENLAAGREALAKLAPTAEARLAKASTEREKDYLQSVEILFGEGDKKSRDLAYAEALKQLAAKYPDDLDAASFHALALLGTCHQGRDTAVYLQAAAIVEAVFAKNPQHPGAAHYLIHAYDDPVHAPRGLRAAEAYAGIAPAAPHALHMPSHIFLALGMWDETAASNEASWAAAATKVESEQLSHDMHNFHALLWLGYAYLQQGRYQDAHRLLQTMEEHASHTGSSRARSHLAFLRAHFLVETERWGAHPARPKIDDLDLSPAASDLFVAGFSAISAGQLAAAREALAALRQRLTAAQQAPDKTGPTQGYTSVGATPKDEAEIMALELEAMLLLVQGKIDEGVAALEQATAREAKLPFGFGPPVPVKPSHELFGEVLISLDRFAEARQQFTESLARAPRRMRSLLGLARAASKAGDDTTAARTYETLRAMWHRADPDLPERAEVGLARSVSP